MRPKEIDLSSKESMMCFDEFWHWHDMELAPEDFHPYKCYIPFREFSLQRINEFLQEAVALLPQPECISKDLLDRFAKSLGLDANSRVLIQKVPFGFVILRSGRRKKSVMISVQYILFEGDDYTAPLKDDL